MKTYEIDGENFSTLEEFYEEISRVVIPDAVWGRGLDAFNDILRGGFGTPDEGFVLRWANHDVFTAEARVPRDSSTARNDSRAMSPREPRERSEGA